MRMPYNPALIVVAFGNFVEAAIHIDILICFGFIEQSVV